ncbi:MAG: hypothetical protein M1826_004064 [Phylliscum demangeonii]|nr:MAG: hypothetical protein M1826_004064 [Phylliscum demangeonii]
MATAARAAFEADGDSERATAVRDGRFSPTTTSPSPASTTPAGQALARFEFEPGRGNDGTKILMVEWADDARTARAAGRWQVSWRKATGGTLTAQDRSRRPHHPLHRLYFMLLPGVTVPPVVTLTYQLDADEAAAETTTVWQINPLPAIFPTKLAASACANGRKGVLHTLWAKKRLAELQREVEAERRANAEGVGLQMALDERAWIQRHFGVAGRPTTTTNGSAPLRIPPLVVVATATATTTAGSDGFPSPTSSPLSATSPKTPGGSSGSGRLAEKLKGLRVATTEGEWGARPPPPGADRLLPAGQVDAAHLPSPDRGADVALSSVAASDPPSASPTLPPQPPGGWSSPAATSAANGVDSTVASAREEDGLFAVAMSPRSPEMSKSPFSFSLSLAQTAALAPATAVAETKAPE